MIEYNDYDEYEHEDNEKGVWDFIRFIAPVCIFAIIISVAFICLLLSVC